MEMPATAMYHYNADLGAQFAESYALYFTLPEWQRLFFYESNGNDCANFISQCIWASYGGWIPGIDEQSVIQNRARIVSNVRQVGGIWHGSASNPGTLVWQRVNDLYDYIVLNNGIGPRGGNIAEGTWDTVDPRIIIQGNIIQMVVTTYSSNRYGHSLYVTRPGQSWDEILICSHSRDRRNTPMSEFSRNPAVYPRIRVISMSEAYFNNLAVT